LVCLGMVLGIPMIKSPIIKKIPIPMLVLLVAIPLGMYLHLGDIKGLVKFDKPFIDIIGYNVSFEGVKQLGTFIQYVILFALIGSLESLLTAKAIDILDPFRRKSDFNKDLIAVGTGNVLAGILGGLPMISEVARSSANVNNGAKTRWANLFHGVFLLIFMLFLTPIIQLIPNAALAALLIGVGIKLAHPREFMHALHTGKEQLLIFVTTVVFTLFVDLLVGVIMGIVVKLIINWWSFGQLKPTKSLYNPPLFFDDIDENNVAMSIEDAAVFTNWLSIKSYLDKVKSGKNIKIDLSKTKLIDHTVMKNLVAFEDDYNQEGGHCEIVGIEEHVPSSSDKLAARKKVKA
jgi:MFS superfamily sulfate permease-like transporter